MRDNPVQFAVVREDPLIEIEILERHHCQQLLLSASGGCTAAPHALLREIIEVGEVADPRRNVSNGR